MCFSARHTSRHSFIFSTMYNLKDFKHPIHSVAWLTVVG